MLILPNPDEPLAAALESAGNPDDCELLGYVLIREWRDAEGYLSVSSDTNLPPWHSQGLLGYAKENWMFYPSECDHAEDESAG